MSKKIKIWLVTATVLVALGLILFACVMSNYDWDFTKLNTVTYVTNNYEVHDEFNKISINADTTEIEFVLTEAEHCSIDCYEAEKVKHSAIVENDTLVIDTIDTRKWYDYICFSIGTPKMTVYLPQKKYVSLFIKTDTGNVKLTDVSCMNLTAESNTGSISLKNVMATDILSLKSDTGNISFEDSDATQISVKTSTGNVTGTLLSEKVFITQTDTGSVDVPKTATGGRCEINTDTGDIKIKILQLK